MSHRSGRVFSVRREVIGGRLSREDFVVGGEPSLGVECTRGLR